MRIDYRSEVDSGFDRKKIVESNIVALLREGIPVDVITQSPEFNFKHLEMSNNLVKGYESKENAVLEIYGGYGRELTEQIVPDNYSGVSHPVGGELYPMSAEEEQEKFKKRDNYIREIEKLQKEKIKQITKERNKVISAITKYKTKFPEIDRIIDSLDEIDNMKENKEVNTSEYLAILKKHGLDQTKIMKYDEIYSDYKKLEDHFSEVSVELENALNGKIRSEKIDELVAEKNILETEIIKRNTKLVNGFIRQKYASLYVETDELFQTCYIAMWKAVKDFNYKRGKFSTFAYAYMDTQVKHCFKELTGYSWVNYWTKKKIETLLETTSNLLERKATINDLLEYGLLDISEKSAIKCLEMATEYSLSDLCPHDEKSYDEYEKDSQYALYFDDDEIDDFDVGLMEPVVLDEHEELAKTIVKDTLKQFVNRLPEHYQPFVKLKFGLEDGIERSDSEVAQAMHVSTARANQIINKCRRKLWFMKRREPELRELFKDTMAAVNSEPSEGFHSKLK